MPRSRLPRGFDLTDPSVLVHGQPHEEFAELRRTAPVTWLSQRRRSSGFDDEGYWAVTRHADVMAISRDTETWSSWENTAIVRFRPDIDREHIDMQRAVMLNMDPPYHTKIRGIVARGFTPRAISALRGALADRADKIVREAKRKGNGEFVVDIASELPLQAIAELMGVPQEDRGKIFDWSNKMVGYDDPQMTDEPIMVAMEVLNYAMQMAEERKAAPRDDIASKLVAAELDGNLTSDEFGFFMIMLAVAGNETTRNAITHGMLAFFEHPQQWELFKAERPKTFVDEVIRWATPVNVFQRTATRDVELGGQLIRKGDRVCLFYGSANFDGEVFDNPYTFDITRTPNPHLGFGGSGAHYCLGANLARLEIELMFNTIADLVPDIRKVGEPERLSSGWVHAIKALPVSYGSPTGEQPAEAAAVRPERAPAPGQRQAAAVKTARAKAVPAATSATEAAPAAASATKAVAATNAVAAADPSAGRQKTPTTPRQKTPTTPRQKAAKAPARKAAKKASPPTEGRQDPTPR